MCVMNDDSPDGVAVARRVDEFGRPRGGGGFDSPPGSERKVNDELSEGIPEREGNVVRGVVDLPFVVRHARGGQGLRGRPGAATAGRPPNVLEWGCRCTTSAG